MSGVVRDAAVAAGRLDTGLLVDARPARRALGMATVAALVLATVAIAMPDDFSLWLRRGVLLTDTPWPRRTHLRLLDFPESGPKIVTRGDDLHVVALAAGDQPPDVMIHYEELSDPDPAKGPDAKPEVTFRDTRRMHTVDGEEGRFAFDFRAVSASFRLWVTGGDDVDEDPVYTVLTLVPPRVASISGKIVYPKYAGLPDAEVRDANFAVLKGSRVEISLTTTMPVALARRVPADVAGATVVPVGADGKSMSLAFDVNESVDFHLELTAKQGQTNRADDDMFHLRASQDQPPELRVLYPPARLYRTPKGVVPVKFIARDDFRVANVCLDVALGTAPFGTSTLWPAEGAAPPADAHRVDAYRPLDLIQFAGDRGPQVKPGDVLHLTLRAQDSHGNQSTSGELNVEVLSEEDFERRLSQRQGTLREELALVSRNQKRARAAIVELRAGLAKSPANSAAVERGRDLQVDQGRVTNDLTQFLSGIHQVLDSYVLDRIGAATAIDKLLPLYHAALALPSDEEVLPASLYAQIVAEKRADRIYDAEVLGALLDIMDLGDRAVAVVSPAVYKSLVAWAGEKAHDPADLERAEKSATDLATLLYEIDQRMQRWGELNLLIELARDIRDAQDGLSKDPIGNKQLGNPK